MKRNLIILFVVILAVVAGFIYFTKDEIIFSKETSMYKAVPVSAPVFVELSALKSVPLENPIVNELLAHEKDILFFRKVAMMDSLIRKNKEIQKGLRNESLLLAFDFVGENEVFPLIILKAETSGKQKSLEKFLSILYSQTNYAFVETEYSNHKITTVARSNPNKEVLHFCFIDGLFLASPKSLLIEQCIRQLNAQSITDDIFFSKVNKTVSAQSKISWYINHQTFPELVTLWLNNRSRSKQNEFGETIRKNYSREFENFKGFAAWSELDVTLKENEAIFNGISIADDSLNHFMSVFDGQEPIRFKADEVLPKNTAFFTSYAFSNKSLFFENLEKYFVHTDNFYKREDRIKKMESGFRINFKNTFQELVKNELIVAGTSIPANSDKKTTLFILETEGKTDAENQLISLLSAHANREKIELNSLKSSYKFDETTQFPIYSFPYPSLPGIWLGKPFSFSEARFVSFYNNYMVFSNSEKGLQDYLYSMNLESSLSKNLYYAKLKQSKTNRANINVYLNTSRIFGLSKEVFNKDVSEDIEKYEELVRKFQTISWQVVCEEGIAFNSIQLVFNQQIEEEAQTTWQTQIGNEIANKPRLAINHRDIENREIIFQDAANNLCQVSKVGKFNWSVSIDGPILSEIHQIDYYRNGKLQYLFNTKSKLYLVDRVGNNVAHFPIKFPSPATNGVNVFDYDNNKKYRYFVACENKKVYAYSNDGQILSGWKFGKTNTEVTTPIKHFRVSNKDYIVFKDQSSIYIQNRRGEVRLKTTAKFENSGNEIYLDLNGIPKLVTTDNTGKVYYLYFSGKFETKKTDKFSSNHFFKVEDIDGNGMPDFIFVDGRELKVMNENGKKLFSEKFKNPIQHQPNLYSFSSKIKKIGVVDSEANRIYLFDPKGNLHKGFPLQGNSEFSIGKITKSSEQLNLLVGSQNADLYNYTLN